jgi:ubiquinone/menaquinone biosynthesis C-methylase UbiE
VTQRRSSDQAHVERIRKAYDTVAEDYADALSGQLTSQPVERHTLERFARRVGTGGTVLDVGGGRAHVTAHLASLGLNVRGIELSPNMLASRESDNQT